MSWTIIRAIRGTPLIRLCPRVHFLRRKSTSGQSQVADNFPADLRISTLFERNVPIRGTDWNNIRENFLKSATINAKNVDQLIVDCCERHQHSFDNAVSFMEFLRTNDIVIDERLQLKLLQLYTKAIADGPIPSELTAKAIEQCDGVLSTSSTLKQSTAIHLFSILSSTPEWRRAIALIDKYDIKCIKSMVTTFSLIAANAFWEDEPTIGWQLLEKIVVMGFVPECISFMAYWNYCSLHLDEQFTDRIEQMLVFIGINSVLVSRKVLNGLQNVIENVDLNETNIDFRGHCAMCRQKLDDVRIPTIDFQNLKKEFEKTSLSKENILAHSTPAELIRFKQHVNKNRRFHYVIDGLNVAHTDVNNNTLERAKALAYMVEYFVQRKKRVLVIGRKHMDSWPERQINYIKTNANLFLTAEKSDDDPYVLYATLVSGEDTDFVSRDQMRKYSQRLSRAGRLLFKQWQTQHQNVLICNEQSNAPFRVQAPTRYKNFCHKNVKQQWHVPFLERATVQSGTYLDASVQWACFKLEK